MSGYRFEIYDDKAGKPRWRFRASNGEIIAEGGESFSSEDACRKSIANVIARIGQMAAEAIEPEKVDS